MGFKMSVIRTLLKKIQNKIVFYYFRITAKLKWMLKVNRDVLLHAVATKVVKTASA